MERLIICMLCMLFVNPNEKLLPETTVNIQQYATGNEQVITPMEALDLVKKLYAVNFGVVYPEGITDNYYYKLPGAEYYLSYEGNTADAEGYLIHLYEFVLSEPDTGLGHYVTYGYYTVDKRSGTITEQTEY